ncbi:MAG TPA: hypothetical protein VMA98_07255 [Candidatus Acidoferrales bacterium]|nr:hypothetical protein [Candidatus Acidoferrales bacterium]
MSGSPFSDWGNFYAITGGASAALTGLVFVVVTLVAGRRDDGITGEGTPIFSSPTVVHFTAAFFISCVAAVPWHRPSVPAVVIGCAGLFGIVISLQVVYRARRLTQYQPDRGDWMWFTVFPLLAYVVQSVAGFALPMVPVEAAFTLAAATVALIFIGIHNAWDVITYLAIDRADS